MAIRARLESSDDVRLEGIYAFGSRVRGDHGGESDLDLLVVVGERTPEVERAVIDSGVEEELRSGIPFDPVIKGLRQLRAGAPAPLALLRERITGRHRRMTLRPR